MKLATIALVAACLLAGCNSSAPTPPPPTPAGTPAARVDASAPANSIQAPPSSRNPAPSASASPQPTPTPDPEGVRTAAAAGYLAAVLATTQGLDAVSKPRQTCPSGPGTPAWTSGTIKCIRTEGRGDAQIWGQYAAALKQLQVPADTAADLHHLIRKVAKRQAVSIEGSVAGSWADVLSVARAASRAENKYEGAVDRVRSDLDLPALCRAGCSEPSPLG